MTKKDIEQRALDTQDLLTRALFFIQANGLELPEALKRDLNKHLGRKVIKLKGMPGPTAPLADREI